MTFRDIKLTFVGYWAAICRHLALPEERFPGSVGTDWTERLACRNRRGCCSVQSERGRPRAGDRRGGRYVRFRFEFSHGALLGASFTWLESGYGLLCSALGAVRHHTGLRKGSLVHWFIDSHQSFPNRKASLTSRPHPFSRRKAQAS